MSDFSSDDDATAIASTKAYQRAAQDLQRVIVIVAARYPSLSRKGATAPTWRALMAIEEQVFAHPMLTSYSAEVLSGFYRLVGSRIVGDHPDAPIDLELDDDEMPAVYAVVRTMIQAREQG